MVSLARKVKDSAPFLYLLTLNGRRLLRRARAGQGLRLLTGDKTFYAIERRILDYFSSRKKWGFDESTPALVREAFELLREAYAFLMRQTAEGDARYYNRKLNTLEKLAKTSRVLSYPVRCYCDVTTRCNLRCKMCGQSFFKGKTYTMPREAVERLSPVFKWCEEVNIFGFGESLLADYVSDLLDIIPPSAASKLVTNGILLGPQNNRMLVDHGLKILFISVDSTEPATYKEIRGVDQLENIKRNIRDLVQYKREKGTKFPEITITFVAMKRNIAQLADFVRMAHELGVTNVIADYLTVFSENMREQSLFYDQERSDRCVDEAVRVAGELGMNLTAPIKFSSAQKNASRRPSCFEPWEFIFFRGDGFIQPCCTNSDAIATWTKGDFEEYWNSPGHQELRRTIGTAAQSHWCAQCFHVCFRDNRLESSHIQIMRDEDDLGPKNLNAYAENSQVGSTDFTG